MPIIALILANLPTIISAGEAGWKFITSVRTTLQQSGAWTPEIEAQFQAALDNEVVDPAWLNDAPTAPVSAPSSLNVETVLSAVAAITPIIQQIHAAVTTPAPVAAPVADAVVEKTIVEPPVNPPTQTPPVVAEAAPVTCPKCGVELLPDSPTNCSC